MLRYSYSEYRSIRSNKYLFLLEPCHEIAPDCILACSKFEETIEATRYTDLRHSEGGRFGGTVLGFTVQPPPR